MPQYRQVTGSSSQLLLYRETAMKKPDPATAIFVAMSQENFADGVNKQQSAIIRNQRGPAKPFRGFLQLSGGATTAADAMQLPHFFRALCGAPTSTLQTTADCEAATVVDMGDGFVGLPALAHGFREGCTVSVTGTDHYDGSYRVAPGTTDAVVVIRAPYLAETLTVAASLHRGLVSRITGAKAGTAGKVIFKTDDYHRFVEGDTITVEGLAAYERDYTVARVVDAKSFEVSGAYEASADFTGVTVWAIPHFWRHVFNLPKYQPTVCFEKTYGFEAGAAETPTRRFLGCKINGLNFSLGGDSQLLMAFEVQPMDVQVAEKPMSDDPKMLPMVPLQNIESSLYIDGARHGDIETCNVQANFSIEQKNAIGDMGAYSRLPEGDPQITAALSAYLESDAMQRLVDANATAHFAAIVHGDCGDEFEFGLRESELSSTGATISGKGGMMQDFTVMAFIEKAPSILELTIVNRVASYA